MGILRLVLLNISNELSRVLSSRHIDKMFHRFSIHVPLFSLQLCHDLVDLVLHLVFVLQDLQAIQKLLKCSAWIDNNGFHGVDRFQRIIHANRVVDFKMGLVNPRTAAGGAAHHLLKQDTGFHTAHKHQCCDCRNIYPRSQQINCNNNAWKAFVLKSFDSVPYLFLVAAAHRASDLHNGVIVHAHFRINFLQDFYNQIGMIIINSKD